MRRGREEDDRHDAEILGRLTSEQIAENDDVALYGIDPLELGDYVEILADEALIRATG